MTTRHDESSAAIYFTDFEHDIARRPEVQAQLEHLAKHTTDLREIIDFCEQHAVRFREG